MTASMKCNKTKNKVRKNRNSDGTDSIIEDRSAMVISYLFISLFYLIAGVLLGTLIFHYIL